MYRVFCSGGINKDDPWNPKVGIIKDDPLNPKVGINKDNP